MNIITHDYIATPAEIGSLTAQMLAADTTSVTSRSTYLKALVATSQADLPKGNSDKAAMLAAVDGTHERFYEAVLKAAGDTLPPRTADRATLLNRRTNFARSSVSMLRSWIKAGGILKELKPKTLTKASLAVERKRRPISERRLKARVEARSKALVSALLALGEQNQSTAAEELELLMGQLTDHLGSITGNASAQATKRFRAAMATAHEMAVAA